MTRATESRLIVGLCGYAGVGKDTAAANMPGFARFAIADPLKADVAQLLAAINCDLANPHHKSLARPLLVEWGRLARRFDPDHWIKLAFAVIDASIAARIVITDVRYMNEVDEILERGGIVIRIHRPRYGAANREEYLSIREIDLRFPMLPQVENGSSASDLGQRVLVAVRIHRSITEEGFSPAMRRNLAIHATCHGN